MAKLSSLPSLAVINGFKGVVDYYLWKGIPVARKWPRKPPRPIPPGQGASAALFGQISADYKFESPDVIAALTGMTNGSAQRAMDMYFTLQYGGGIYEKGAAFKFATEDNAMLNLLILPAANSLPVTLASTGTAYHFPSNTQFRIPFDLVSYNRYRLYLFGQSSVNAQSESLQMCRNNDVNQPVRVGGNDLVVPRTNAFYDSGPLVINTIPAAAENWRLAVKGSSSTTNLIHGGVFMELWQEL